MAEVFDVLAYIYEHVVVSKIIMCLGKPVLCTVNTTTYESSLIWHQIESSSHTITAINSSICGQLSDCMLSSSISWTIWVHSAVVCMVHTLSVCMCVGVCSHLTVACIFEHTSHNYIAVRNRDKNNKK